jgi:alpha-L-rhamnosidase
MAERVRDFTLFRVLALGAGLLALAAPEARAAPVRLVAQAPVQISSVAPGVMLVDFGRVAFGNLRLLPPAGASGTVTVHFGEALAEGRVNRQPPGTVRYSLARATLAGAAPIVAAPPPDARNTRQPAAVLTPPEWGVITPFRWVEIEGWPGELRPEHLRRQAAFASTWDDHAAAFSSSDEMLDRIWELCRYSIKATTFAGVYVDGDRERISYEADAHLNQLSQYATDHDVRMARDTFDRLMAQPTWPTEWAFHMIFIAHADWLRTGDAAWLGARYEALKPKLLLDRARADGLLVSAEAQRTREDIVDWPAGERDGYVFTPVNTVVNAFHLRALALMAELADAAGYRARERSIRAAFQQTLFDPARGVYRDGEGTEHASLHANLLPRFVLGAQPLSAGWRRARIRPNPGSLTRAAGTVPTPSGPVPIAWTSDAVFRLTLTVPGGMSAQVELPAPAGSRGVYSGGKPVHAERAGPYWRLAGDVTGSVILEVR